VPRPHPDGVDGHEASQPPLRARNLPVDRGPGGDH
jgi:hypothetical protein